MKVISFYVFNGTRRLRFLYAAVLACSVLSLLSVITSGPRSRTYYLYSLLSGGEMNQGPTYSPEHPVRPFECKDCFKHTFKYTLNEANICDKISTEDKATLIILITSAPTHFNQRQQIRQTWAGYSKNNTAPNVRHAFVLGAHAQSRVNKAIETESLKYRDIIQEDFADAYHNLTLKTVMSFKWVDKYCQDAKFYLKTDDDMLINIPNLLRTVRTVDLTKTVAGDCMPAASPVRDRSSKWYVSYATYPNATYPGFCSGTGYVMKTQVARDLYRTFKDIPFYHLEDIFVSFSIFKLGYKYKTLSGFHRARPYLNPYYFCNCVVTAHELEDAERHQMWRMMLDGTCVGYIKTDSERYCYEFRRGHYIGLALAIAAGVLFLAFLCYVIFLYFKARRFHLSI